MSKRNNHYYLIILFRFTGAVVVFLIRDIIHGYISSYTSTPDSFYNHRERDGRLDTNFTH